MQVVRKKFASRASCNGLIENSKNATTHAECVENNEIVRIYLTRDIDALNNLRIINLRSIEKNINCEGNALLQRESN